MKVGVLQKRKVTYQKQTTPPSKSLLVCQTHFYGAPNLAPGKHHYYGLPLFQSHSCHDGHSLYHHDCSPRIKPGIPFIRIKNSHHDFLLFHPPNQSRRHHPSPRGQRARTRHHRAPRPPRQKSHCTSSHPFFVPFLDTPRITRSASQQLLQAPATPKSPISSNTTMNSRQRASTRFTLSQ